MQKQLCSRQKQLSRYLEVPDPLNSKVKLNLKLLNKKVYFKCFGKEIGKYSFYLKIRIILEFYLKGFILINGFIMLSRNFELILKIKIYYFY